MPRPTHYDILQVPASAPTATIREAYRRLAREHHPDRLAARPEAATDLAMPEINEAYRVLGDPARRAVYDAELRGRSAPPVERGPTAAAWHSSDQAGGASAARSGAQAHTYSDGPRIPWRSMLFVGAVGVLAVIVLAQFVQPAAQRGPDGLIEIGSCVVIEPNGDAREIACVGDPEVDRVVEAFVPFASSCPTGTVAHRDRQGMGIACLADGGEIRG